ncbi:MAG: hypothetical protein RQ899_12285 [Pseudomonadales bacterium]|nr:hypothetical protein [Pseudomonadales bacterium]
MAGLMSALLDPAALTHAQWLALAIILFVVIASIYFVWRLYRIISRAGKSTYKPNIGLSRVRQHLHTESGQHGRQKETKAE